MKILESIKETIKSGLPHLCSRYPIEKLGLFGSVTRNDFSSTSDIDILVETNGSIGWELVDLALELEKMLGRKVDLITKDSIKPRYVEYVMKDIQYV